MSQPLTPLIRAETLTKIFPMPAGPVTALDEVSLEVGHGESVAITGPSGCGKSTLLHLLGCVDTPTSGSLIFDGSEVAGKKAIMGALRLYLDFINLFIMLLHLFGQRD